MSIKHNKKNRIHQQYTTTLQPMQLLGQKHMPLPNKCLYINTIYKATVKTNNSVKHYIGATEGTIKQRIHNHNLSFKYRNFASNTSLSSYIWQLKDTNISPTITWETLKQAPANNKTSQKCLRCLHEKLAIITYPSQNTLLNKKNLKSSQNVGTKTNTFFHISTNSYNPPITSYTYLMKTNNNPKTPKAP